MKHCAPNPCSNCPFRDGPHPPYLRHQRAADIAESLRMDETFYCHKTTAVAGDDDDSCPIPPDAVPCAGAVAVMLNGEEPNQMLRIAGRMGMVPESLQDGRGDCYDDLDTFVDAHA